ncbi:heterokaryon incompatibility protein-domain-containing protein [Alternaria alternata]|nr:heterokaryon incompatibility protein-domain-containing protein [Alternaria alternata]
MFDLNSVSFTDQDQNDDHWASLDVRYMKGSEGEHGTKRKLHYLVQNSDSTNEQDYDRRRDPKRTSYPSETPTLSQEHSTSFQSNDICDECRSLNLHVLIKEVHDADGYFAQKRYIAPWERVEGGTCLRAGVGFRYRRKQFTCPLCRALAASRITPEKIPGANGVEIHDNGDEIQVKLYNTGLFMSKGAERHAVRLILVPHGSSSVHYKVLDDHTRDHGSLALFDNSTSPKLFRPQLISPSFDPDLVGSWLTYCTRYHRRLCRPEPVPVRGVQVIDCNTLQIEEYNAKIPYVSLSYVWGNSNDACGPVETIGGRKTLPQQLPAVIKDSIEVTKALGFQYLWIDKFCIDQDAADLKHDQIQQMDAIYANSQLTIISAAGQDESFGLPGVGGKHRSHQFTAKLDDATAIWSPSDPHRAISQSHWSTRGWTFQEALLSLRRLVFTEGQMYFQCNTMNCFESNYCALDELHVKDRSKTLESIRAGTFGQHKHEPHGKLIRDKESLNESLGRYLSNVENYTSRNLRFDEDSLNAFQGIIKKFSQEQYAFNHVWGLAYPSNGPRSLGVFVHSLTWMHRAKTKARRRNLFPSWTWAGWEGHIAYEVARGKVIFFDNAIHDLRFKGMADGSLSLEELGEDRSHPVLRITATAVSLGPNAYRGVEKAGEPWRIAGREAVLSWSSGDRTDSELAEMFKDTLRWHFVYIGDVLKQCFVMILELGESGRTWQRVVSTASSILLI